VTKPLHHMRHTTLLWKFGAASHKRGTGGSVLADAMVPSKLDV
jgi:hypothetical protein